MITNNILLQLKSEKTVFINGLGTFQKQLISAKTVKGKMQPPKYKLIFDENADGNSFNFVLKLSKNEKLRITDVDKQVRQWVIDLKQTLSENGSCTIEDFGTFSLLKNGKISFKSGELALLNREFEGMEEVKLPEILIEEQRDEKRKDEEAKGEKEKVKEEKRAEIKEVNEVAEQIEETLIEEKVAVEEKAVVEEIAVVEEKVAVEEKNIIVEKTLVTEKKKRSLWWLFMLIILLVLALLFALFREPICNYTSILHEKFIAYQHANTQRDKTTTGTNSDMAATPINSPETVDAATKPTDSAPVESKAKAPVEPKASTPKNPTTSPLRTAVTVTAEQITFQAGKFYLISGSFKSAQEAQRHINVSDFNKYHASILTQPNNDHYRVCIGIFENEEDAERYKALLKIRGWVLKE
jgi:cell division septation protein DedD/nucleoid DNA-binding protein